MKKIKLNIKKHILLILGLISFQVECTNKLIELIELIEPHKHPKPLKPFLYSPPFSPTNQFSLFLNNTLNVVNVP